MPTTTSKIKRRPAIPGPFKVLVVPASDVIPHPRGLTVPLTMIPKDVQGTLQIVANAGNNGVSASFWAFDSRHKRKVIKDLRALADFLESNVIRGGNPPVS